MIHAAPGVQPGDLRRGLRTTLAGQASYGRHFDDSVTASHATLID